MENKDCHAAVLLLQAVLRVILMEVTVTELCLPSDL